MPLYFFDTSALVKRYHIEAGSEKVNELFDNPEGIFVITSIAVTEFVSALARKLSVFLDISSLNPVMVTSDEALFNAFIKENVSVIKP
jgi:predicted nucleic acid-binding protein